MPSEASVIAWLGAVEGDVRLVGGKAASLDRLARLGFEIPPGFVLTTVAFDRHLASLAGTAESLAALPDESARRALTAAFETGALAAPVRRDLDAALVELVNRLAGQGIDSPRFAVRSSGIGEDSSAASFAGLHETELGVEAAGVEASVRRCWASLWSAPAIAYRQRRGLALDGGGMAVVIQALVPADASAVAFTMHPVTGRTDQLVVTSVRGLGDAMVSGTVNPDTFVLDRPSLCVSEFTPGEGGSAARSLDDASLGELARLAVEVERGCGSPVDIEAARAGGRWYLVQARPITTR
ncbi:MAG: PEP/pyruvate-binding domain-containing protein [Candidatus Limnocylindrales bacterium]